MTDQSVFILPIELIEQFLADQAYPPLTADERSNLVVAFWEGADLNTFIHDAICYLRGDDCGVADDEQATTTEVGVAP